MLPPQPHLKKVREKNKKDENNFRKCYQNSSVKLLGPFSQLLSAQQASNETIIGMVIDTNSRSLKFFNDISMIFNTLGNCLRQQKFAMVIVGTRLNVSILAIFIAFYIFLAVRCKP